MSLQDKAKKLNASGGIPFMGGREKKDIPLNTNLVIVDFGFITAPATKKRAEHDYAVIAVAENPDEFYFGGMVVTEKLKALEEDLEEIQSEGLPVIFTKKMNKDGDSEYMDCEFYPDEIPFK